jgi:hypothetical protein
MQEALEFIRPDARSAPSESSRKSASPYEGDALDRRLSAHGSELARERGRVLLFVD